MALESGFFNSVNGDRLYNAEQMSRYFENILSSGIFKRIENCLKVSANNSMELTVAPGGGLIDCHWFRALSAETVTIPTAHAVLPRFDIVVARLNMSDSVRAIALEVVSGTPAESPAVPEPLRTTSVYDLVLALVYVAAGTTAIAEANLTDVRDNEWYCGYVQSLVDTPIIKTFHYRYTASADNTTVAPIGVTGYNAGTDLLNVYVNGFRLAPGNEYSVNTATNSITLMEAVDAGTIVDFEVYRPIMPDDIPDLAETVVELVQTTTTQQERITELEQQTATLATQALAAENQLATIEPIVAGDFEFGEAFVVTGFASSQSERVYFSIPFNRPIIPTTCTVKTMKVTARQSESYVLGSATAGYEISGDVISTRLSNNGMLTIVAEPTFSVAPFNNAEVSFYIEDAVVTFK